jgi:beta-mannosidase
MLGLDLDLLRIPFYHEVAPRLVGEAGLDAVYVPGAPSGGELPLRPDRGVSNYYAVGGYRAPLSDARTSGVRFASECLAFANVPDEDLLATLVPEPPHDAFVHHPRWKAGVPRDSGSGWDFDDLRDDYLAMLFGVEPRTIRRGNHDRYLELSRAVSGEVMAAVFGEWRRAGSPSGGGLILWLRDLVPGAGWGVVDHRGRPKAAWHHLRRILAPTAVWLVDEGIGGVVAHVANDGPAPLEARLRVAFYSDLELPVGTATADLALPAHGSASRDVEAMLGHFVDAAWAYRFGPPAQDAIVASLERDGPTGVELLAQAFHFPAGRPLVEATEGHLGLEAAVDADPDAAGDGALRLSVRSRRLAYGVRIHVDGFAPSDDAFSVEPGGTRLIRLVPRDAGARFGGGWLTALNLRGRAPIRDGRATP